MDRLAAGVLIAGVALALNAGMLGETFADAGLRAEGPPPPVAALPDQMRTGSILSLLVCLEALRAAPELIEAG
jgi:hypothetical protein